MKRTVLHRLLLIGVIILLIVSGRWVFQRISAKPITVNQVYSLLAKNKIKYDDIGPRYGYKVRVLQKQHKIYVKEDGYADTIKQGLYLQREAFEGNTAYQKTAKTPEEKNFISFSKDVGRSYGRKWKVYVLKGNTSLNKKRLSKSQCYWIIQNGHEKYGINHSIGYNLIYKVWPPIEHLLYNICSFFFGIFILLLLLKNWKSVLKFILLSPFKFLHTISKPSGMGLFSQFMPHEPSNYYNNSNHIVHNQASGGIKTVKIVDDYGTQHEVTPDHSGGGYDQSGNYYYYDGDGRWSPSSSRDGK